jgi:putative LysE/RhtB family amino acid efflux pump
MDIAAAIVEFARGGLAGLVVCIPPGPMSALCVSRSVRHGFAGGFAVAAGSALGDATYVATASFGVASFRESLGEAPRVAALVAAPLLLWMGVRMLRRARRAGLAAAETAASASADPKPNALSAAATGYAMAIACPGTLPALVAFLAASGAASGTGGGIAASVATTAGALGAALAWWCAVAALACRCRAAVAARLHLIDAAGGALLVLASLAAVHVAVVR